MNLTEALEAARAQRRGEPLRPSLHSIDSRPPEQRPENCPKCGTRGRVDIVDTVRSSVELSCPSCDAIWQSRDLPALSTILPELTPPAIRPSSATNRIDLSAVE